jgi:hypothetical protein
MLNRSAMLLGFLCLSLIGVAQYRDSLEQKYLRENIVRYGNNYLKGNDRLSFAELEREFAASPDAYAAYRKARSYKNVATVCKIGLFASSIAVLSLVNKSNPSAAYISFGAILAFSFGSSHYQYMSLKQTDQALMLRNRQVLFPPAPR